MRDDRERRPGRGPRFLLRAQRLLVVAGTGALAWCAVLAADAVRGQRLARLALEAVELKGPAPLPAVEATADATPPTLPVQTGSPVGILSIPRLGMSVAVLHGSDQKTLRHGPGHLENTAFPGQLGNAVIAGHRDSFFWPLRNIQLEDDIFVDTPNGTFHYRVASVRVVEPRDVSVLASTDEAVLTLITCYPFWVVGNAPDRLIVRARAVVNRAAVTQTADVRPPASDLRPPASDLRRPTSDVRPSLEHDDEVLVRLAVERYRLAYNGRLTRRNEARAGEPLLQFPRCDVSLEADHATAICASDLRPSRESEPSGPRSRRFTLQRSAGGWAIQSIALQ